MKNNDLLAFIEGLYKMTDSELKLFYKHLKNNRDDISVKIANIMLDYNISDNLMKISKAEKNKLIRDVSLELKGIYSKTSQIEVDFIDSLLLKVAKDSFKFWNYNIEFDDVRKLIEDNFKGKHFSDRVWDNEQKVVEVLNKTINDFLDGKINVNQIKKSIKDVFDNGAYNTRRLVETEVARVQDSAFKKFCNETGVKKIRRVSILDLNTCQRCTADDNKVYSLDRAPSLPEHPLCRCFFDIVE